MLIELTQLDGDKITLNTHQVLSVVPVQAPPSTRIELQGDKTVDVREPYDSVASILSGGVRVFTREVNHAVSK